MLFERPAGLSQSEEARAVVFIQLVYFLVRIDFQVIIELFTRWKISSRTPGGMQQSMDG